MKTIGLNHQRKGAVIMAKWSEIVMDATVTTVTAAAAFTTALVAANLVFIEGIINVCRDNKSSGTTSNVSHSE